MFNTVFMDTDIFSDFKVHHEPWPHMVIEDFLPEQEFLYHKWKVEQNDKQFSGVDREFLNYDPFPYISEFIYNFPETRLNNLEYNDDNRKAHEFPKFVHYASTSSNYKHVAHVDSEFKLMSAVLYLSPDKNHGTRIWGHSGAKTVPWKPNTLFVFCGLDNVTWHDYKSMDTRHTLNWFLVDPDKIKNPEYKKVLIW